MLELKKQRTIPRVELQHRIIRLQASRDCYCTAAAPSRILDACLLSFSLFPYPLKPSIPVTKIDPVDVPLLLRICMC